MTPAWVSRREGIVVCKDVFIVYRNHRGEVSERKILPRSLRFGVSLWHPEPQWFLEADDVNKAADRTFALKDILQWRVE